MTNPRTVAAAALLVLMCGAIASATDGSGLRVAWKDEYLTISGTYLPGRQMKIHYLEAFCRPGSTDRRWDKTVILCKSRLTWADGEQQRLKLQSVLDDGVLIDHEIIAGDDQVEFRITAHNPTSKASQAHWAQPCIRVDAFTGRDKDTYLDKCFIFLHGKLARMPTPHWAMRALYTPGQVWCPANVPRTDVNPRPLSDDVPDNGLIGCFSADEKTIMAVAFEPYQELFQGVICCLHSDFRIGGLEPGQAKKIRGRIYIVRADVKALLERYRKDFPEHAAHDGEAAR